MRDSQRQRVYDSEHILADPSEPKMTVPEMQKWVDEIVGSAWWRHRSGIGKVLVLDGRGRRSACATTLYGQKAIKMPRWMRSRATVLHELAHHLSPGYHHDAQFAASMLGLVRRWMGETEGQELKASYRRHKVHAYNAPKPTRRMPKVPCHLCRKMVDLRKVWVLPGVNGFCTKKHLLEWVKQNAHQAS